MRLKIEARLSPSLDQRDATAFLTRPRVNSPACFCRLFDRGNAEVITGRAMFLGQLLSHCCHVQPISYFGALRPGDVAHLSITR
jgi:hypothetical protein